MLRFTEAEKELIWDTRLPPPAELPQPLQPVPMFGTRPHTPPGGHLGAINDVRHSASGRPVALPRIAGSVAHSRCPPSALRGHPRAGDPSTGGAFRQQW